MAALDNFVFQTIDGKPAIIDRDVFVNFDVFGCVLYKDFVEHRLPVIGNQPVTHVGRFTGHVTIENNAGLA